MQIVAAAALVASAFLDQEKLGDRAVLCLDAATGKQKWRTPLRLNPWGGPTVAGDTVVVGKISGVIRGMTVALQASARVEGDIHHMSLAIEQCAEFDGRCRRPQDASELKLDLDGMSNGHAGR